MEELDGLASVAAGAFVEHFRRDDQHITGCGGGGDAGGGEAQGATEDDDGLEVIVHVGAEAAWLAGLANPCEHFEGWVKDALVSNGDDFSHAILQCTFCIECSGGGVKSKAKISMKMQKKAEKPKVAAE